MTAAKKPEPTRMHLGRRRHVACWVGDEVIFRGQRLVLRRIVGAMAWLEGKVAPVWLSDLEREQRLEQEREMREAMEPDVSEKHLITGR